MFTFASDRLGWSSARTDEILLPVLKQLNKDEVRFFFGYPSFQSCNVFCKSPMQVFCKKSLAYLMASPMVYILKSSANVISSKSCTNNKFIHIDRSLS